MVALFCSSNQFNLCYPRRFFPFLDAAKSYAFKIAVHYSGKPLKQTGRDSYIAGADPRTLIPIYVVRCEDE